MKDPNSLLYWFPKIVNLGIPVPRTEIVKVPYRVLLKFMDKPEVLEPYVAEIEMKAKRIGFPLFLRTDQASGKHGWKDSCYVPNEEELFTHIYNVVEFNFMADVTGLPCEALVLREFIELDWKFKAFWGEMPVARERRYFVRDGKVLCHHPYWIEDAIEKPNKENWRELLKELNTETDEEIKLLSTYAKKVSSVMDGYWSIDFAHTRDGRWILIDMALGDRSWHPECKFAVSKL